MKHIVDNVNTLEITFKTLDLAGRVPFTDSIELLGVELQYHEGRGPLFMGVFDMPLMVSNKKKDFHLICTKVRSEAPKSAQSV